MLWGFAVGDADSVDDAALLFHFFGLECSSRHACAAAADVSGIPRLASWLTSALLTPRASASSVVPIETKRRVKSEHSDE